MTIDQPLSIFALTANFMQQTIGFDCHLSNFRTTKLIVAS